MSKMFYKLYFYSSGLRVRLFYLSLKVLSCILYIARVMCDEEDQHTWYCRYYSLFDGQKLWNACP